MSKLTSRAKRPDLLTTKEQILEKGNGKNKKVKVLATPTRRTCTKGKECAYAHVKETSSPNTAGKAAGGTKTPPAAFPAALGLPVPYSLSLIPL